MAPEAFLFGMGAGFSASAYISTLIGRTAPKSPCDEDHAKPQSSITPTLGRQVSLAISHSMASSYEVNALNAAASVLGAKFEKLGAFKSFQWTKNSCLSMKGHAKLAEFSRQIPKVGRRQVPLCFSSIQEYLVFPQRGGGFGDLYQQLLGLLEIDLPILRCPDEVVCPDDSYVGCHGCLLAEVIYDFRLGVIIPGGLTGIFGPQFQLGYEFTPTAL